MSFFLFFCVHDTAATHGQDLALSKAWWSCSMMKLSFLNDKIIVLQAINFWILKVEVVFPC